MILFIGEKPSTKNTYGSNKAFVGTQSYRRLLDWLYKMNVSLNDVAILNVEDIHEIDGETISSTEYSGHYSGVITLGAVASIAFNKTFGDHLETLKMPHPSPRNFKLNNEKYEEQVLAECEAFIKARCEGYTK